MRVIPVCCLLWFLCVLPAWAGEQQIVLREQLKQSWSNELVTFQFKAKKGTCAPESVTLTGPQGPVPVQLSQVELWPASRWDELRSKTPSIKSARLSFVADLKPLATAAYTVRYGSTPSTGAVAGADLQVTPGPDQVDITTRQFGVRLLLGEKVYSKPVPAAEVPGPVNAMRMADPAPEPAPHRAADSGAGPAARSGAGGTWFGGSRMYGPARLSAYSARLTDAGPVFARVAVRYTYENSNTLDVAFQVTAGDNTVRCETQVKHDQPKDGFDLVLSRGLQPLIFLVQDEVRRDRDCFMNPKGYGTLDWAELPLKDYVAPKGHPAGLVTQLSPWEDWFGTFTQTRIRLKLEGTARELQIRSLEPGAWVEPREIEEIFSPALDTDPAKGMWVGWGQKCMPILRDASGEVSLQVNAAQGVRKWTVSDCRSMPGAAALFQWHGYKPESTFPPETRPTVGYRLNEVKDYVLDWPGDAGRHPRLFVSRSELEARWKRQEADPALLDQLLKDGSAKSAEDIFAQYMPNWTTDPALGAYLLSGGSPGVAEKTQLLARLRQALQYDLYGMQFGCAGSPAPILYDAVIDSPWVPEAERRVLRAQMAYYAYRLADPAVWSAERGYASGNQNMTVTWEISRGIMACAIPEHPMARTWYRKTERIMEYFLDHMVGPAGEWPESMGGHGRTSIDMILAFAVASSNSGLHDYTNDPRVKRMVLWWAKMETPRDPRPRGIRGATPNRRYFPAMGRDCIGGPGGTCGVMARMACRSDPAYAADLQWAWLEEGGSARLRHLGGFSYVSCDRRLPARTPAWTSEMFPYAGAVLRHGLETSDEHQVMLYSGDHFAAFYPGHTGSIPSIFAYGTPVAGSFAGSYEYQEGFLCSHVDLARGVGTLDERSAVSGYHGCAQDANMWGWPDGQRARFGEHGGLANVSDFSALPRQDYAAVDVALHYPRRMVLDWKTNLPAWPPVPKAGKPPVDWRRQVLFLKDDDPANTAYLLIRDSVKGGQPTMWQMWTLSEKIGTPEEAKDLTAFLADKPGYSIRPSRELKGDRFTAVGQMGVDVEYFIASPSDTPRHTLRWGTDMIDWANKLGQPEYQDLLHLQLPGDGTYYVAFFPRKRGTPAPTFSTLGDGTVIKVSGDFGTDFGFLSALETAGAGEDVSFRGTAASVQDRKSGLVLTLGAKGEVRYQARGLAADFPVSLRVRDKELTVELPHGIQPPAFQLMQPFPGGVVTVTTPGNWALAKPLPGVRLTRSAGGYILAVPSGLSTVPLVENGH